MVCEQGLGAPQTVNTVLALNIEHKVLNNARYVRVPTVLKVHLAHPTISTRKSNIYSQYGTVKLRLRILSIPTCSSSRIACWYTKLCMLGIHGAENLQLAFEAVPDFTEAETRFIEQLSQHKPAVVGCNMNTLQQDVLHRLWVQPRSMQHRSRSHQMPLGTCHHL